MSLRLDAQDEKFRSERPRRLPVRKSGRKHVTAYLRTVPRPDDNVVADMALAARDGAS